MPHTVVTDHDDTAASEAWRRLCWQLDKIHDQQDNYVRISFFDVVRRVLTKSIQDLMLFPRALFLASRFRSTRSPRLNTYLFQCSRPETLGLGTVVFPLF